MTTLNAPDETGHLANPPAPAPVPTPSPSLGGDPAMLGLPTFIVGSIALGLVLVGMVPATGEDRSVLTRQVTLPGPKKPSSAGASGMLAA